MHVKCTYRPELEGLEQRVACSVLVAGFNGNGIWRFTDGTGWKKLSASTPVSVAVNDQGDVVASFSGAGGVWRYLNTLGHWELLTHTFAGQVGIDDTDRVFAELGNAGVWRFTSSGGWSILTQAVPTLMAVSSSGDFVGGFQSFRSKPGLWRFEDATGWQELSPLVPQSLSIASNGDVAAGFTGNGTFGNNSTHGWVLLTATVAAQLAVNSNDFAAASFSSAGTWYYSGFWTQIRILDSSLIGMGNDNHIFAAQPDGLWEFIPGVQPTRISALNAVALGVA